VKGEVMNKEFEIWVAVNGKGQHVASQRLHEVTDAMDDLLFAPCSLYKLLVPLELPTAKQVKVEKQHIQEVSCDE